jgi:Ni/Co efflux regulator RcnB
MPDIVERAEGASPIEPLRVRVGSPATLLAAVPPLLGFKPSESSLVVVGAEPPRGEVRMTLRFDIPDARYAGTIVDSAIIYLATNGITTAAVVGYGSGSLVDPVAREFLRRFPDAGIKLTEVLRTQSQRYWSYVCKDPECCPPEGTPFDTLAHPAAAKFAGKRVLASRAALAQTIAPVTGEEAEAMARATRRAEAHARRLIREAGIRTGRKARRRALHGPGLLAVNEAITRYRNGQGLGSRNSTAWLALVLEDLPVRDDAWARMDPEYNAAHLRLWADVTRLAQPGYVAAPAALLAFTAWQSGSGALANIALDRALADQPDYSMARLLRQAVDCGAPPSVARLPMTPEEVAASYDAMNTDGEDSDHADEQQAGLIS